MSFSYFTFRLIHVILSVIFQTHFLSVPQFSLRLFSESHSLLCLNFVLCLFSVSSPSHFRISFYHFSAFQSCLKLLVSSRSLFRLQSVSSQSLGLLFVTCQTFIPHLIFDRKNDFKTRLKLPGHFVFFLFYLLSDSRYKSSFFLKATKSWINTRMSAIIFSLFSTIFNGMV